MGRGNSLTDHLKGMIDAFEKDGHSQLDGVVDWCIVLVEMQLTRSEECWPLPTESIPELP